MDNVLESGIKTVNGEEYEYRLLEPREAPGYEPFDKGRLTKVGGRSRKLSLSERDVMSIVDYKILERWNNIGKPLGFETKREGKAKRMKLMLVREVDTLMRN